MNKRFHPFSGFGEALGGYGWIIPLIVILILTFLASYVEPTKHAKKLIDSEPPPVPDLVSEQARGAQDGAILPRGAQVGATPSKLYPRPIDRGFKYSFVESPNWSSRGMNPPEAIVLHVFGSGTCAGLKSWFRNPASQVSAHFGVCKNAEIVQFVEIGDSAWHAGIVNRPHLDQPRIAFWIENGINPNLRTVGIEIDLKPGELIGDYPEMAAAFDDLLLWLLQVLKLDANRANILGHFEIDAINRAVDPICCLAIDLSVAYAASRLNPTMSAPIAVTLESIDQRLRVVEERLNAAGFP